MPLDHDQTFSRENFKLIWDRESRRNRDVYKFTPGLEDFRVEIKAALEARKVALKANPPSSKRHNETLEHHREVVTGIKQKRREHLEGILDEISDISLARIANRNFNLGLRELNKVNGKQTYSLDHSAASTYFTTKQLEVNLKSAFSMQVMNRHRMVEQIRELLGDPSPKTFLKSDLASFYESVSHARLMEKLELSSTLSRASVAFISELLNEYRRISGNTTGLPRGVGLSSFLAEIYLQNLDDEVRNMQGITYYSRYVDDMVIIAHHKRHSRMNDSGLPRLRILVRNQGLQLNGSKTRVLHTSDSAAQFRSFRLLGYDFKTKLSAGRVELDMSKERYDRHIRRIESIFQQYYATRTASPEGAETALVARIRLLTTNHRSPKSVGTNLSGIAFTNRALQKASPRMQKIDQHLRRRLDDPRIAARLRLRTEGMTVTKGFEEFTFSKFSPKHLANSRKIWRYEN